MKKYFEILREKRNDEEWLIELEKARRELLHDHIGEKITNPAMVKALINLRQDSEGVYYLHDYVPKRCNEGNFDKDFKEFREDLWEYKDYNFGKNYAFNKFTHELMEAVCLIINDISKKIMDSNITVDLYSVPPSSMERISTIAKSISVIKKWFDQGVAKTIFQCYASVNDCGKSIERKYTVPKSRSGKRLTVEQQLDSLSFNKLEKKSPDNVLIIIDDIVTRGVHMDACELLICDTDGYWVERLCLGRTVKLVGNKTAEEKNSLNTDFEFSTQNNKIYFSMNPRVSADDIDLNDYKDLGSEQEENIEVYDDEYEYEYAVEK